MTGFQILLGTDFLLCGSPTQFALGKLALYFAVLAGAPARSRGTSVIGHQLRVTERTDSGGNWQEVLLRSGREAGLTILSAGEALRAGSGGNLTSCAGHRKEILLSEYV